jgi:uncharacterized protein YbjT (DUF2867 family)
VGDVMNEESLFPALKGVQSAYYLIHNMASGVSYRENERIGARNFGRAAKSSGLDHIIFLGGLGGSKENRHMQSRQETGRLLRESGVSVTEFRSSIIIGSGSISFELIRYLTTWFPFIPAPVQTNQPGQPIGIKDLLTLLTFALEDSRYRGEIIEIGGPEVINYPDIMAQYARIKGLNRPKIKIPFFPVSLSAGIADLLTPVPYAIAYPLMQELEAPSIVRADPVSNGIKELQILSSYENSVQYAVCREEYGVHVSWLGVLSTREPLAGKFVRTTGEGFYIEHQELDQAKLTVFGIRFLSGDMAGNWELDDSHPGEWIRIKKRMRLVGRLFIELQFKDSRFIHTILFEPNGIIGLAWWYLLLPFHSLYHRTMIKKMTEKI